MVIIGINLFVICLGLVILITNTVNPQPKLPHTPRHYACGKPIVDGTVVGIPSWQYPTCIKSSTHLGTCKDANGNFSSLSKVPRVDFSKWKYITQEDQYGVYGLVIRR